MFFLSDHACALLHGILHVAAGFSGNVADTVFKDLPRYLSKIVPPVLACFTDQDARVRYYACEAMYNIAKVAKGEILMYFNNIFDQLCKVSIQKRRYQDTLDKLTLAL